jgi:sugar-specific transcriptional regulator TrmB
MTRPESLNGDNHIGQLTQLGLNIYEAKAYVALLGRDSSSATEVAELSGVPRQRIYDILASLVERGMAISRPGRHGTKYAAVAPTNALAGLLEREQKRLSELQAVTSSLATALGRQYKAGQEVSTPLEYIEVLRGRQAINQRFAEIQEHCKKEILIFTKPPYAMPPQEDQNKEEVISTLKRQIVARSVYEYSVLANDETRRAVELFVRSGEDARFVERLPLKLVIVDEEIVMFAMEDPIAGRTELTIMVVEQKQLAEMMKLAFETMWARGDTFDTAISRLGVGEVSAPAS